MKGKKTVAIHLMSLFFIECGIEKFNTPLWSLGCLLLT